jgi:uncharacterized protein
MPSFHVFLPVAGVSVNIFLLVGMGLMVGFLAGLFGVGGGFLLTPLLMMIGIPPTVAAASDANQIVAASASGTFAHWRLGNVDFKMGLILIIGGLIGGTIGVQIIKMLREVGEADFVIKITYVIMLGIIGVYMFQESLGNLRPRQPGHTEECRPKKKSWFTRFSENLPLAIDFKKSGIRLSIFMPLILGAIVGMLSAMMGIGGGFIMVPVMIYLLRMPMHVVVGTNLFQELFICINVTFMQSYYNRTVDFMIAILLLIGSTSGAQIGARLSNRLKADHLKIIMATVVLLVMVKIAFGLLHSSGTILTYGEMH